MLQSLEKKNRGLRVSVEVVGRVHQKVSGKVKGNSSGSYQRKCECLGSENDMTWEPLL